MKKQHILVVDDEREIRELVKEILEDEGYEVSVAKDGASARLAFESSHADLILLDIWLPDIDGISLLKELRSKNAMMSPVIMISGHGTVETAVEATRLGAYDFLEKPLSLSKLLITIQHALETSKLKKENLGLRRHVQHPMEPLGNSHIMKTLREQAKRIAQHDTWVLISGEAGCGKELFAHYIYAQSPRANGPYVEVRAASITGTEATSLLFGRESEGKTHYGFLDQAHGGTLLLDEISDMDTDIQAKLFSALESRTYTHVGGTESIEFDIRIIASTSKDLRDEIEAGRFREDLYYQLDVVPLYIPPLREHAEDIPQFLDYYVDFFVTNEHLPYRKYSIAAQNYLRNHRWTGNIRELKNLVQRMLILGAGDEITYDDVERALGGSSTHNRPQNLPVGIDEPLREARMKFEKAYFEYHVQAAGGNMGKIAKIAGIERTHLYRKLKALDINIK